MLLKYAISSYSSWPCKNLRLLGRDWPKEVWFSESLSQIYLTLLIEKVWNGLSCLENLPTKNGEPGEAAVWGVAKESEHDRRLPFFFHFRAWRKEMWLHPVLTLWRPLGNGGWWAAVCRVTQIDWPSGIAAVQVSFTPCPLMRPLFLF